MTLIVNRPYIYDIIIFFLMYYFMIDLHCHSYFSDGTLSPKELIEKALRQQIQCLSLYRP